MDFTERSFPMGATPSSTPINSSKPSPGPDWCTKCPRTPSTFVINGYCLTCRRQPDSPSQDTAMAPPAKPGIPTSQVSSQRPPTPRPFMPSAAAHTFSQMNVHRPALTSGLASTSSAFDFGKASKQQSPSASTISHGPGSSLVTSQQKVSNPFAQAASVPQSLQSKTQTQSLGTNPFRTPSPFDFAKGLNPGFHRSTSTAMSPSPSKAVVKAVEDEDTVMGGTEEGERLAAMNPALYGHLSASWRL
ncbi:hypothetical protein BJY04DRAFT_219041 [Aspergillus karnatakaensis]|uniref:uncharacterized protein n=1 Tax=Aspergillus karnatakaensis TaxID=1810916 RepID=UPI003CCD4DA5